VVVIGITVVTMNVVIVDSGVVVVGVILSVVRGFVVRVEVTIVLLVVFLIISFCLLGCFLGSFLLSRLLLFLCRCSLLCEACSGRLDVWIFRVNLIPDVLSRMVSVPFISMPVTMVATMLVIVMAPVLVVILPIIMGSVQFCVWTLPSSLVSSSLVVRSIMCTVISMSMVRSPWLKAVVISWDGSLTMEWVGWMRSFVPALWSPAIMRIIVLIVIDFLCTLPLWVIFWFLDFSLSLLCFLSK